MHDSHGHKNVQPYRFPCIQVLSGEEGCIWLNNALCKGISLTIWECAFAPADFCYVCQIVSQWLPGNRSVIFKDMGKLKLTTSQRGDDVAQMCMQSGSMTWRQLVSRSSDPACAESESGYISSSHMCSDACPLWLLLQLA